MKPGTKPVLELLNRVTSNRSRLVKTELRIGLTLGHLALTRFSIGNSTAGNRAITKAEQAYQAILRYSPRIQMNTDDSAQFHAALTELERLIELVRRQAVCGK